MKVGIMQPYFLPYMGYFQLINAVDTFVLHDNVKFTKKGWIHRNRILVGGKTKLFTVPLEKGSDALSISERALAGGVASKKLDKTIRVIGSAYRKALYYDQAMPVLRECFSAKEMNLFDFIYFSIKNITEYLGIKTKIVKSSRLGISPEDKGQARVLSICRKLKAEIYINPEGGKTLYTPSVFLENGVELHFLKMSDIEYNQFSGKFVPKLSIIDVMMHNSKEQILDMLKAYVLE